MQFKIPVPIEKLLKDKNALGYAGRNIIVKHKIIYYYYNYY